MRPQAPAKPKKDRVTSSTTPDTNIEVLPRNGKVKSGVGKKKPRCLPKTLSKKKRKRLEDIVARRHKKENRSSILSKLGSLPQVTAKFENVINIGKKKKKRKINETDVIMQEESEDETETHTYAASDSDDMESEKEEEMVKESPGENTAHLDTRGRISKAEIEDDEEPLPFPTGQERVAGLTRVALNRTPEVIESRAKLPILSEEHTVLDAVATNSVCIICGSTGSGKTTQVPQFLYEAGYASKGVIGVTEPRRVAAISMSHRVAEEMNLPNSIVSYKIRFEKDCGPNTRIKFMTDGTLMKELEDDFLLMSYSVIILDEAHERSEFTDILISLLSRIVPLRKKRNLMPLKLVIMSATLRIEDFINKQLFKVTPPVVNIEGRQFPVTAHFQKKTPSENEYLKAAYKRICKVHRTLPPGAMLVFVTGKDEINILSAWLGNTFPRIGANAASKPVGEGQQTTDQSMSTSGASKKRVKLDNYDAKVSCKSSATGVSFEHEMDDDVDCDAVDSVAALHLNEIGGHISLDESNPLFVLPLHSYLSVEEQSRVFQAPPEGSRLCVISTNVAETSLTIPNIRYVVDTGKEKRKVYDTVTGVSVFITDWVSKASADQRAGRAGRTTEGHCYRLYSSAVFQDFVDFGRPLILQRPVDDVVLLLKNVGIMNVSKFPFPNSPSRAAILAGEKHLYHLGALSEKKTVKGDTAYVINELGKTMSSMGLAPRFAKMVAMSNQTVKGQSLLPYTIALVSAFTVRELFYRTCSFTGDPKSEDKKQNRAIREAMHQWRGDAVTRSLGDIIVMLNAITEFEDVSGNPSWCNQYGLRYKAMHEIRLLRKQLTENVNSILAQDSKIRFSFKLPKLTSSVMVDTLRQILLSGLGDRVARRAVTNEMIQEEKINQAISSEGGGGSETKKLDRNAYQAVNMECSVYIHPHSVLFDELPEFIAFQEIVETSKVYAKDCFAVDQNWLPLLFPSLCTFSDISQDPPPYYEVTSDRIKCHMTCNFANNAWPISTQMYDHPKNVDYFKIFARFLLEGTVFKFFESYVHKLVAKPVVMVKPWSNLQSRTRSFLVALTNADAFSKERLKLIWEKDPNFLLKEYLEWLPDDATFSVQSGWPPKK